MTIILINLETKFCFGRNKLRKAVRTKESKLNVPLFCSIQECACCYCIANLYTVWQTDIRFNEVCPKISKTVYTSGTRMFKRVIYDTEIFNLEFNLSHSPIPKILVIAQ